MTIIDGSILGGLLTSFVFMIEWEKHKSFFPTRAKEISKKDLDFLQWKYERDLYYIKKKYDKKTDSESIKKEIEELNQLIEKLRKHVQNVEQIPEDPEQQSEIQKMIVNAPKLERSVENWYKSFIKDPETGMWWDPGTGLPAFSPKIENEREKYVGSMSKQYIEHSWDYTRGRFYNIFVGIIKQIFFGGGSI